MTSRLDAPPRRFSAAFDRAWARRDLVAATPDVDPDDGLFVCLAPMDGVTDHVYRELLTGMFGGRSGISLCVSEFVRVTDQPVTPAVFRRHCPELDSGGTTTAGVPVFVQLLGGLPGPMADNAVRAAQLGAPGIDLNFGCPAKTVNRHDGGATLLKTPRRVYEVTRAVRDAVPDSIPVTVKIRVGWDSAEALVELAHAAEDAGGAWLTVHARTRTQLYKPPVIWDALAHAVDAVEIPVVANGDIVDTASLRECAAASQCHAFMIGRGAMARPDGFAEIRGWSPRRMDRGELAMLLTRYARRLLDARGRESPALARLKQWLRMGATSPRGRDPATNEAFVAWFDAIKRLQSLDTALAILEISADSGTIRADENPSGTRLGANHRARRGEDRRVPA